MEITFISDTHSRHHLMTRDLPGGPMIIHCGDVSTRGRFQETQEFIDWFASLPYMHKIFIAGNHDFIFEKENNLTIPDTIHYLQDSSVTIEGIKIYGSPWQPWFYDWAFNLPRSGPGLASKWESIPVDTDILVVHGPPKGILDRVYRGGENVGCELLRDRILEVKPRIVSFGHIHEAYGKEEIDGVTYINASMLDLQYEYTNSPTVIDYSSLTQRTVA
jgi:Icc-related predicted phosphoesterase